MKKRNLLMMIIGCGILLTQIVRAETVDLENVTRTEQNVVVGEIDVPVYSVDIIWGDMTFDYKYNGYNGKYEWREQIECIKLESDSYYDSDSSRIYMDSNCDERYIPSEYDSLETLIDRGFYEAITKMDELEFGWVFAGEIQVHDGSHIRDNYGGFITPTLTWTSENEYSYVEGDFLYTDMCSLLNSDQLAELIAEGDSIYTDSGCENLEVDTLYPNDQYYGWVEKIGHNKVTLPVTSAMAGFMYGGDRTMYSAELKLKSVGNSNIMPTAGDIIGRITVNIETR